MGEAELALGYDASPILGPIGAGTLSPFATATGYRVGDAGPLVGGGAALQLRELIAHTGHTLLVLTGQGESVWIDEARNGARHIAERFRPHVKAFVIAREGAAAPDTLIDPSGQAHARLAGGDEPCVCLVRPDGHLGLRAAPPELAAVERYLERIFL